jgi:hypothetical protein
LNSSADPRSIGPAAEIYAFIKDPDGYILELTERHPKMGADGQTSQ